MKLSAYSLGLWLIVIFLAIGNDVKFARSDRDYITWDDLKIGNGEIRRRSDVGSGGDDSTRAIVVDPNGSGDSTTVQGAVDLVPLHNSRRVKIYIRPGTYREKVHVPQSKPYISFIGDESRPFGTIITWNNKASDKDKNGQELGTYNSASVAIDSDYFCATGITFENTVVAAPGEKGSQAVALRVVGDKAVFYRVRILGSQDTLLDHHGTHYYYKSYIKGSIDFIFGNAKSLYKACVIHSTAENYGAIAAQKRESPYEDTGFSFVRCRIDGTGKILLGRAWGKYSRTIYSYCKIGDIVTPSGWSYMNNPHHEQTAVFGEYKNTGKGADRSQRVPWSKSLNDKEARHFLRMDFIDGDQWLRL